VSVARLMNRRALRSASTSRTCWDVNALMCSGRPARPSKWHTPGQGAGGEVFSQLQPRRRPADHPGAGDELFDFPADIGRVPARAPRPQPGQDVPGGAITVQGPDRDRLPGRCRDRGGAWVVVAEPGQLLDPGPGKLGAVLGHDLVWAVLGPRPGVP